MLQILMNSDDENSVLTFPLAKKMEQLILGAAYSKYPEQQNGVFQRDD